MNNSKLIIKTLNAITPNLPQSYDFKDTYESIIFPDGYTKPSKEEFDIKYNQLVNAEPMNKLREERDNKLLVTDYNMCSDYTHINNKTKQAWIDYRQKLRDITETATNISLNEFGMLNGVTWPTFSDNIETDYTDIILFNKNINNNHKYLICKTTKDLKNTLLVDLCNIDQDPNYLGIIQKITKNYNVVLNENKITKLWVTNKSGVFTKGDYVTTSSISGYGMKQITNNLLNSTVAKITCSCTFSLNKVVKEKLKFTNITNSNGNTYSIIDYDTNGNPQYEDDLDADGNQQMVYPYDTRFLLPDGTQITEEEYNTKKTAEEEVYIACLVGCTYHCG